VSIYLERGLIEMTIANDDYMMTTLRPQCLFLSMKCQSDNLAMLRHRSSLAFLASFSALLPNSINTCLV